MSRPQSTLERPSISMFWKSLICTCIAILLFGCVKKDGFSEEISSQIQWTGVTPDLSDASNIRPKGGIWDGRQFVLEIEDGRLLSSANGVAWKEMTAARNYGLDSLVYGDGVYLAKGKDSIYLSTDAVCWTRTDFRLSNPSNIVRTNGQFYIATKNAFFGSPYGKSWQKLADHPFGRTPKIFCSKGWIIANADENYWQSRDGIGWRSILKDTNKQQPVNWRGKWYATSYTNSWICAFGNQEWNMVLRPKGGLLGYTNGFAPTQDHLFAFGTHISWSEDGIYWGSIALPEACRGAIVQVVAGDGRYLAIGDSGLLMVGFDPKDAPLLEQVIIENKARLAKLKSAKGHLSEDATLKEQVDYYNFPDGFYREDKSAPAESSPKKRSPQTADLPAIKNVNGLAAEDALEKIFQAMGIKDADVAGLLSAQRKENPNASEFHIAQLVLKQKKHLLWFDAEAGTYPVGYDWLVTEFSQLAAQQQIRIDRISMTLEKLPCGNGESYSIRWNMEGKRYGIDFFDDSDWYSPLVVQALNTCLYLHGYEQRFIWLDTGDQTALYMLIEPDVAVALGLRQRR